MRPKQLIIDKNVFVGTKTNALCDFAKNYFLILPEILLYECLTAQKDKEVLLDRFEQSILGGGYICPNIRTILNEEAENLSPYSYLVNRKTTQKILLAYKDQNKISYNLRIAEYQDENVANFLNPVGNFYEEVQSNDPVLSRSIRQFDAGTDNRLNRFKLWVKSVERQDIHGLATENLEGITVYPEKYCLSDEWVSWHFLRLMFTLALEYSFLRHHSPTNITENRAEHDLKDAEYVLLLSRADGLLTRDEKLVKPLAKAAFPDKDVFSSFDKVPEDYKCEWT